MLHFDVFFVYDPARLVGVEGVRITTVSGQYNNEALLEVCVGHRIYGRGDSSAAVREESDQLCSAEMTCKGCS